MQIITRLDLDKLSTMTNAEKDTLIVKLFDLSEDLRNKIERLEAVHSESHTEAEMERRKFQRTKVSGVNVSFCEVILPTPKEDSSFEYKKNYTSAIEKIKHHHNRHGCCSTSLNLIQLRLYDISVAGCSMLNHDEEFSYFLTPHKVYENCRIVTTEEDEISISFEIMTKRNMECYDAHKFNELIGIKFLEVKHSHAKNSLHRKKVVPTLNYEIVR